MAREVTTYESIGDADSSGPMPDDSSIIGTDEKITLECPGCRAVVETSKALFLADGEHVRFKCPRCQTKARKVYWHVVERRPPVKLEPIDGLGGAWRTRLVPSRLSKRYRVTRFLVSTFHVGGIIVGVLGFWVPVVFTLMRFGDDLLMVSIGVGVGLIVGLLVWALLHAVGDVLQMLIDIETNTRATRGRLEVITDDDR